MNRRNSLGIFAVVGLFLTPPATSLAQYGGGYGAASGYGYSFMTPDTAASLPRVGSVAAAAIAPPARSPSARLAYPSRGPSPLPMGGYINQPQTYTYNINPSATTSYGVWTNAPSALTYSAYGFPGNAYQPTQPSYLPYSPYFGSTPAGYGTPVTAITFQTPNGPVTLNQAATNVTGNEMLYRAGYMGFTAPTPFYSYGLNSTFGASPANPTYGASSPSLTTPYGTYGNLIGPTGVPTGAPMLGSGTFGFGVNPGSP